VWKNDKLSQRFLMPWTRAAAPGANIAGVRNRYTQSRSYALDFDSGKSRRNLFGIKMLRQPWRMIPNLPGG